VKRSVTRSRGQAGWAALAALALVSALGACSAAVAKPAASGYAIPDPGTVNAAAARQFDSAVTQLRTTLAANLNLHGVLYKHGQFGKKTQDGETSVTVIQAAGSPDVTTFGRDVTDVKHAGDNIDTLHQAGSPYDYWLMGTTYKTIAPHGWVRMPAITPGTTGTYCVIDGIQTACDLLDLIKFTADETDPTPTIVKQVSVASDGALTLTTGVTVRSLLVNDFVVNIPTYISKTFTPAALNTQLTLKIVMSQAHHLQLIQLSGTVPGSTPLVIQDGFLVDGPGDPKVVPAAPAAADTTVLPTVAARRSWLAKVDVIVNR
jgi:hypothetical protein